VADKTALRSSGRKILRNIFGFVQIRGKWRVCHNVEINELIEGQDIVRFMKAQRIRWLVHVGRIWEEQVPKEC
jgi:hypothetical protein